MADWACEEKLAAVALGGVGLAILEPGTVAAGAVGGGTLEWR